MLAPLLALTLAGTDVAAGAARRACPADADVPVTPVASSWTALHRHYARVGHCDDGHVHEDFSHGVLQPHAARRCPSGLGDLCGAIASAATRALEAFRAIAACDERGARASADAAVRARRDDPAAHRAAVRGPLTWDELERAKARDLPGFDLRRSVDPAPFAGRRFYLAEYSTPGEYVAGGELWVFVDAATCATVRVIGWK